MKIKSKETIKSLKITPFRVINEQKQKWIKKRNIKPHEFICYRLFIDDLNLFHGKKPDFNFRYEIDKYILSFDAGVDEENEQDYEFYMQIMGVSEKYIKRKKEYREKVKANGGEEMEYIIPTEVQKLKEENMIFEDKLTKFSSDHKELKKLSLGESASKAMQAVVKEGFREVKIPNKKEAEQAVETLQHEIINRGYFANELDYIDRLNETTDRELVHMMRAYDGNLAQISLLLQCSRQKLEARVATHIVLKEERANQQQAKIDFAEQAMVDGARRGNITAAKFILSTIGRDRGYIEKKEIKHEGVIHLGLDTSDQHV